MSPSQPTGPGATALHVGFLVPAYGVEILGGAEYGARMIAEHLAALGCRVSVWTTTAVRAVDWAPHYPAATTTINGVEVHRFAGSMRADDFPARSDALLGDPAGARADLAEQWIDSQGPMCPAALDAAEAGDADVVVLYPYLYWPTVHGARRLGPRAVLQPAAHDEWPIRLPLFDRVFAEVGGLMFQTDAERRLVGRLFPASLTVPQTTLGLGVELGPGDETAARQAMGIGDRPYVLCLGRVNDLKGTTMLAEWWAAYKARRPGPLALVLAGPVAGAPAPHPDILVTGPVRDEVKWGALRGAQVLVSPSAFESFSLVLLEAWSVGRPVMVNGACGPTVEHCRRSGGGIWFGGYATFEAALSRLDADGALRSALGEAGRAYVEATYAWPVLARRYRAFLTAVAARRAPARAEVTT